MSVSIFILVVSGDLSFPYFFVDDYHWGLILASVASQRRDSSSLNVPISRKPTRRLPWS